MKMEDQVASVEPAKELRELDVKQDGYFSYFQYDKWDILLKETREIFAPNSIYNKDNLICSAYTVAELGEMLPIGYRSYYYNGHPSGGTWMCNDGEILGVADAKTEADARAKMLAYLIKEGLIEVEELK